MSATPAAEERIAKALELIQSAQMQLSRAVAELSTLRNIGSTWARGSKLFDSVHAYWYRVRALSESRHHITTDKEDPF